jgi:cytochrome c-type biogenesis protein CcmH/NrfG
LKILAEVPDSEQAWLGLASVAESPDEIEEALVQALKINPDNRQARQALARCRTRRLAASPWTCPLCQASAATPQSRCPTCQAVVTLGDLDAILHNDVVDREKLNAAIARYEKDRLERPNTQTYYGLGMAYLNAKQFRLAAGALRIATRLRPKDKIFAGRVQAVLARLASESPAPLRDLDRYDEADRW